MTDPGLAAAFLNMVKDPTRENYVQVLAMVSTLPEYDPYSGKANEIAKLLGESKFAEVKTDALAAMPGWILSPRMHQMVSLALNKLGEERAAKMERFLFFRCLKAIQSTGDGSEDQPYIVSAISDEYDVLRHLGKKLKLQSIAGRDGRRRDCLHCEDGTMLYFDISTVVKQLHKGREE